MITQEAYLELERSADFKSEYYRGETFAMSGATRQHVRLVTNLVVELSKHIDRSECFIFSSDLRVHIPANSLYTYPDIGIVCGEEKYLDEHFDTLLNPAILIEILSPSTESYDRGQKFSFYREIESLQEYALVAQDRISVEVFYRNGEGGWELRESDYEKGVVVLSGQPLLLDDIYRGISVEASPGIRRPIPE